MITAIGPVGTGGIADGAVTTAKILDDAVTTEKIPDDAITTAKQSPPEKIKRMCSGVIGGNILGELVTLGKITTPIMITNIELLVGEAGLTGNLLLDIGWVDDNAAGLPNSLVAAFPPGVIPAAPQGTVIPLPGTPIPVAGPVAPATAVMLTASAKAPDALGDRVQVAIEYYEIEEAL